MKNNVLTVGLIIPLLCNLVKPKALVRYLNLQFYLAHGLKLDVNGFIFCPRQELNLSLQNRSLECYPLHHENVLLGFYFVSVL